MVFNAKLENTGIKENNDLELNAIQEEYQCLPHHRELSPEEYMRDFCKSGETHH
ncbi:hypothetical protein Mapa_009480 [Marchantia paleacea]|nr:hypothetical protein Mapa_009480 [Marchantia paleacea]